MFHFREPLRSNYPDFSHRVAIVDGNEARDAIMAGVSVSVSFSPLDVIEYLISNPDRGHAVWSWLDGCGYFEADPLSNYWEKMI